ncbi:uncharacterized protein HMPREF1541_07438 [Cyphellophora europaea CBS 101466]|uniref:Protein BIG1 n=1 Tax=Cyphellophora europaea (strain CBS 101466) TaxID=1220924 RepID=W2RNA2_CYPE1|nr:uncharacterized protein HMPREF1541_07438 [Cyphellophora europaea CBS 101466]ETN37815.1 hypothetical protein HMPREF1541_07438 [Cyphellophora europaea CBS 101466]
MRVASFVMAATLLLSDLSVATKAVRMLGVEGGYNVERRMDEQARNVVKDIERRQSSSDTIQSSASDDRNSTIATACLDTLSGITSITNDAGISACYNIMEMDQDGHTFTADLRLYLAEEPRGAFTTVQPDNLMIGVTYPESTVFTTTNTKRSLRVKRQAATNMTEIQQYTLMGSIDSSIDLDKLTNDQVMSLMVPAITVNAVSEDDRAPVETALTTTDTAYFVVGEFRGEFSNNAASAEFQAQAIEQSSVFVLPGTTLGIFPTGMIITLSWLLIFVLAYGWGTWRRYQHREFYRKRMHMAAGMPSYEARTGKKI